MASLSLSRKFYLVNCVDKHLASEATCVFGLDEAGFLAFLEASVSQFFLRGWTWWLIDTQSGFFSRVRSLINHALQKCKDCDSCDLNRFLGEFWRSAFSQSAFRR